MQRNPTSSRIDHMGSNYENLFQVLPQEIAPAHLCERIEQAVLRERERHERTRLVVSSLTLTSSILGLVFALPALMHAANTSGFNTFASLMITDGDLVTTHFSMFGLSLLEALPGLETTVTLFLLSVFLVSLKNFVQSIFYTSFHRHVRAL